MIRLPVLVSLVFASIVTSFPQYGSLAGLSEAELAAIIPTLKARDVEPPPPPLAFNGTLLSNNPEHPFKPLRSGDIRGPCPALNTLASHGVCQEYYLFCTFLMPESFSRSVSSA